MIEQFAAVRAYIWQLSSVLGNVTFQRYGTYDHTLCSRVVVNLAWYELIQYHYTPLMLWHSLEIYSSVNGMNRALPIGYLELHSIQCIRSPDNMNFPPHTTSWAFRTITANKRDKISKLSPSLFFDWHFLFWASNPNILFQFSYISTFHKWIQPYIQGFFLLAL